jgi:D-3-phosphoglycerate dehydrogenase
MSDKPITILATTSSFGADSPGLNLQLLVNPWGRKLKEEELLVLLEKYRPAGLLAGTEPITRAALERARGYLKVISRVGAGWDNIDHQAAAEFGLRVYRTAGVLTQAVAELTIGLILAALRAIPLQDRWLRRGTWQKRMGGLLQGKTVGLIGFGAIGQRVGELVRAFGARVIFTDPKPPEIAWAAQKTLRELLEEADIISLHASGKSQILGQEELGWVGKAGAIIVNTARGELIDEEALCASLAAGRIGFACLDVFGEEPYRGRLCELENLVLTPHIGSYALETRRLMEATAIDNLRRGLQEAGIL